MIIAGCEPKDHEEPFITLENRKPIVGATPTSRLAPHLPSRDVGVAPTNGDDNFHGKNRIYPRKTQKISPFLLALSMSDLP